MLSSILLCLISLKSISGLKTTINSNHFEATFEIKNLFYIEIEIKCSAANWCALGWGDEMTNADAILLLLKQDLITGPQVEVSDIQVLSPNSTKHYYVDPTEDLAVLSNLVLPGGALYAKVIRKLVSDDPLDYAIDVSNNISVVYALGDQIDKGHTEHGKFNFTFQSVSLCHYLCRTCIGPLSSDCLACSAKKVYPIKRQCSVMNLELMHASVTTEKFTFYWGYPSSDPEYIYINVEYGLCDWLAIGFGNSMNQTDMVVFRLFSNPTLNTTQKFTSQSFLFDYIEVFDLFSQNSGSPPLEDSRLGEGSDDWELMGYQINRYKHYIKVKAKRKIDTGDKWDFKFGHKHVSCIWAVGNGTQGKFHKHVATGSFSADFAKNDTRLTVSPWNDLVYSGHTQLNFILWGIVTDIGIFFARQLKSYPKYVQVHGILLMFVLLVTYFYVFTMIDLCKFIGFYKFAKEKGKLWMSQLKEQRTSVIWHFSFGVAMLTLMTFQLLLGWMIKQDIESKYGSAKIYQIKRVHCRVGYIVYVLGKVNIALGLHLYESNFLLLYIVSLFYLMMAKLVIEFFYRFNVSLFTRRREQYSKIETERSLSYSRIMDRLQNDCNMRDSTQ